MPLDKCRRNDYNNIEIQAFVYLAMEAQFYEWLYKRKGSSKTMGRHRASSSKNLRGEYDSRRDTIFKLMGNPRGCDKANTYGSC
jgi:hypothetical protein